MRGAAANVEKRAIGTRRDQPPVVLGIEEAEGRLFLPNAIALELPWIGDAAPTFSGLFNGHHTAFGLLKTRNTIVQKALIGDFPSAFRGDQSLEAHDLTIMSATRRVNDHPV
jgi:hypothetical protein